MITAGSGFDCYIKIPADTPITIPGNQLKFLVTTNNNYKLTLPATANANLNFKLGPNKPVKIIRLHGYSDGKFDILFPSNA